MKKLLIYALFFLITLTAVNAHALGAGASLGVFVPQGDMLKDYNPGFGASLYVEQPFLPLIKFRLAANYAQAENNKDGNKFRYTHTGGQLLGIVTVPVPVVNLYGGAGYGVYRNRINFDYADYHTGSAGKDYDEYGHGPVFKAGVGVSFAIIYLGLEGQYIINAKSGDKFDGFSVGLGAGLSL